jgi:NADH-quinone oxidoreductase subunit G
MPTFKLDGKDIPFQQGETIIHAAHKAGIEIPHYCWHPGLSIAANCRMCLVEILPAQNQRAVMLDIVEWDAEAGEYRNARKPKLQPSCQIQAADGMQVLADSSPNVLQARKTVQELLLLNHPVDCPICDQAGECKLQDYWLEHGRFQKRMQDEVVHKPKAVSFGPTIVYDAERCVMCTRCIRFMDEVAKDPVLEMRERGNLNEIMVAPGREVTGHYTYMLDHVCPVGALTTKDFRFKARVWFLRSAKTVCQGCATGCNAWIDFDPRMNQAYRHRPRENAEVNKWWMCDEGMLSYRRAHEGRVVDCRVKGKVTTPGKAGAQVEKLFVNVPRESIAVVLSSDASLEDNWAFAELAKLLGTKSVFYTQAPKGDGDAILRSADKSPNAAGVRAVAPEAKPFADFVKAVESGGITHALVLGGVIEGEPDLGKLTALVVVAVHEGRLASAAHVVFPATSWAESPGTWVNAKGLRQTADRALEPQGGSRPGWEHAADLARGLGLEPTWGKLKDIRTKLGSADPRPELHLTVGTQAV